MREDDESSEDVFDGPPSGLRERVEDLFRAAVRKTVSQGVGAALHTEDMIRQRVTDLRLPKEVATYLITTIDHTRRELVRMSANEVRAFLERANLAEEVARILTTLSLDIRIQMKFVPNDQAIRPSVKSQVRVRHGDDEGEESAEGVADDLADATPDAVLDAAVREVGQEVLHRVWRGLAALSTPTAGATDDAPAATRKEPPRSTPPAPSPTPDTARPAARDSQPRTKDGGAQAARSATQQDTVSLSSETAKASGDAERKTRAAGAQASKGATRSQGGASSKQSQSAGRRTARKKSPGDDD